jgi:sec-independent protein translocase protein TatA
MGALQPVHLIVILVIVLVVFGPGKLPQLGRAIGDGVRELKRATSDDAAPPQTATAPSVAAPVREPVTPHLACPACQASVPTTDQFCGSCGARMRARVA